MPPAGGTSVAGVSGGGGEPRAALVVETDETEVNLFTPAGLGILRSPPAELVGGG